MRRPSVSFAGLDGFEGAAGFGVELGFTARQAAEKRCLRFLLILLLGGHKARPYALSFVATKLILWRPADVQASSTRLTSACSEPAAARMRIGIDGPKRP